MQSTKAPYKINIFDLGSEKEFQDELTTLCKTNEWYYRQFSEQDSRTNVYNFMLSTIATDYAVFLPINVFVTHNWLTDLQHYYESIKNSGAISIPSDVRNLTLSSKLFDNPTKREDEMRVVWVNSSNIMNDFIFFQRDRIEKIGRFDEKQFDVSSYLLSEFSFRFIANGFLNYYITKNNCVRMPITNDEILFPTKTKEDRKVLQEHINAMVKSKHFKK